MVVVAVAAVMLTSAVSTARQYGPKMPYNIHVFKEYGEEMVGTPYIQGGGGKDGIDNTGLITNVFRHVGVVLPRDVIELYHSQKLADSSEVPLTFGDLVFFDLDYDDTVDYAGIYWGDGNMLSADPTEGKADMRDISTDFWINRLEGVRRVVESARISVDLQYPFDLEALRDTANSFLDVPYRWNAKELDLMDSSGLTYNIYRQVGVTIPQTVNGQYETSRFENVSADDMRLGDLIFFYSNRAPDKVAHVGMYWDSGLMIHTDSGPGQVVFEDIATGGRAERIAAVRRLAGLSEPFAFAPESSPESRREPETPEDTYMDLVEQSVATAANGEQQESPEYLEPPAPPVLETAPEKSQSAAAPQSDNADTAKTVSVEENAAADKVEKEVDESAGKTHKKRKKKFGPHSRRAKLVTSRHDKQKTPNPQEAAPAPEPENVEVVISGERRFEVNDNPPTVDVPITAQTQFLVKEPEPVEVTITAEKQFEVKEPEMVEVSITAEKEFEVKEPETEEVVIAAKESFSVRDEPNPAPELEPEAATVPQSAENEILIKLAKIESASQADAESGPAQQQDEQLEPKENFANSVVNIDTDMTQSHAPEVPGEKAAPDEPQDYLSADVPSTTVTEIEIVKRTEEPPTEPVKEEPPKPIVEKEQEARAAKNEEAEIVDVESEKKEDAGPTARPDAATLPATKNNTAAQAEQPESDSGWVSRIAGKAEASPELSEIIAHSPDKKSEPVTTGKQLFDPAQLREAAQRMVGVPYKWGAKSTSATDSSGVVFNIYRLVGIRIPGSSLNQYKSDKFGIVSKKDIQLGDILFFDMTGAGRPNHVAMYLGSGKMIFASESAGKVVIRDFDTPFWRKHFMEAKRLIQK